MPTAPQWTAAEDETVRAMVAAGNSQREIVAALNGRTLTAVQARIKRLGLRISRQEALQRCWKGRGAAMAAGVKFGRPKGCSNPKWTEERKAAQSRRLREMLADPVHRQKRIEALRKAMDGVDFARLGRLTSERRLAWCPVHLRADYHWLYRNKVKAAEARQIILDEWCGQLRRALRQIAEVAPLAIAEAQEELRRHNSFEARLARVAAGKARVVNAVRVKPVAAHDYSLTGNSLGMLS